MFLSFYENQILLAIVLSHGNPKGSTFGLQLVCQGSWSSLPIELTELKNRLISASTREMEIQNRKLYSKILKQSTYELQEQSHGPGHHSFISQEAKLGPNEFPQQRIFASKEPPLTFQQESLIKIHKDLICKSPILHRMLCIFLSHQEVLFTFVYFPTKTSIQQPHYTCIFIFIFQIFVFLISGSWLLHSLEVTYFLGVVFRRGT